MAPKEILDVEDYAWKLASVLLQDFKPFLDESFFRHADELVRARNLEGWRTMAVVESEKPFQFKLQTQVSNLFKKFTFTNDVLTPKEVYETSVKKFMDNQERLLSFDYTAMSPLTADVVQWAKGWLLNVLGDFNHLDIVTRATFGKKSSVGIPRRKACEAERYEKLTGSREHIEWFEHYYSAWNRPAHLYASRRAANRKVSMYECVDELEATLVPKNWKSLRMIFPNTTIGSLYSGGLGKLLEDRLRNQGFDIRLLQPVHGELARAGSVDGSVVTADQALASDNITEFLVRLFFPRPWAQALCFGRISRLRVDGKTINSPTFSTMGIGFTFPLQTLLFLSILFGVKGVMGLKRPVISVFGDDMIYSREMHTTVLQVFAELGLKINEDKTFADGYFRESCGFDFFRGYDVRPAHLAGHDGTQLSGKRAEAYLYQSFNAVKRKWSVDEVPATMKFMMDEMSRFRKTPMVVPSDYPEFSGMRLSLDEVEALGLTPPSRDIHGTYNFSFLSFRTAKRVELREWPYYALSLKVNSVKITPSGVSGWDATLVGLYHRGYGDVLEEKEPQSLTLERVSDLPREEAARLKQSRATVTAIPSVEGGRYHVARGARFLWCPMK